MKIAIIGCGVIGSALARHFAQRHQVLLCDHTYEKSRQLAHEIQAQAYEHPMRAIEQAEMVVLAFKPKDLANFAAEMAPIFQSHHLLVSVLAGTPVALLQRYFPSPLIIRAMPNLPMICGEGIIGFVETAELTPAIRKRVEDVFQGLGLLPWLSEEHLEALSAIAGSGPAFVFVLIEAMIASGIMLGFSQEQARDFVLKTIEGSVALLKATGKSPLDLKINVASPGGTTMAGLKVLDEQDIQGIIQKTYQATYLRAQELQK
ncbi:MAG: pyrroline-5-carboxylate reductase [Verrucomicrobia bacterium]|nr:pyrroline-5-carboxylate reductase [Verrucomicrobiota bacterium]